MTTKTRLSRETPEKPTKNKTLETPFLTVIPANLMSKIVGRKANLKYR